MARITKELIRVKNDRFEKHLKENNYSFAYFDLLKAYLRSKHYLGIHKSEHNVVREFVNFIRSGDFTKINKIIFDFSSTIDLALLAIRKQQDRQEYRNNYYEPGVIGIYKGQYPED